VSLLNQWSIAVCKLGEYIKAPQHVDVIVEICHDEERVPIP
jgi:hypothetical protein